MTHEPQIRINVPPWLGEIVKIHMERLRLLNLEGAPLGRAMGQVTRIWAETITGRREWDRALDTPRLHQTFLLLAEQCQRWPTPARFLSALPPHPPPKALPEPEISEAQRRANLQRLAELFGSLEKKSPPKPKTCATSLTPTQEEALLEELRQYQASKKSKNKGDLCSSPPPDS